MHHQYDASCHVLFIPCCSSRKSNAFLVYSMLSVVTISCQNCCEPVVWNIRFNVVSLWVWLLETINNPGTSNSETAVKLNVDVDCNELLKPKATVSQQHVMEIMDDPSPRSLGLIFFIWTRDYCKALAQRRCSRKDHKPHMVQNSSGRSAVRVLETSRSRLLHMAGDI